eukprot:SAG11_NODE_2961_length_2808_cov_2.850129_1_plen_334_part_00
MRPKPARLRLLRNVPVCACVPHAIADISLASCLLHDAGGETTQKKSGLVRSRVDDRDQSTINRESDGEGEARRTDSGGGQADDAAAAPTVPVAAKKTGASSAEAAKGDSTEGSEGRKKGRKKRKGGGSPDPLSEFRRRIGLANATREKKARPPTTHTHLLPHPYCTHTVAVCVDAPRHRLAALSVLAAEDTAAGLAAYRQMVAAGVKADAKCYNSVLNLCTIGGAAHWDDAMAVYQVRPKTRTAKAPQLGRAPTRPMLSRRRRRPPDVWGYGLQAGRGDLHLPHSALRRGGAAGAGLHLPAAAEGPGHQPQAPDVRAAVERLRQDGRQRRARA